MAARIADVAAVEELGVGAGGAGGEAEGIMLMIICSTER